MVLLTLRLTRFQAVVLTCFCSSPDNRARLSVNVSAIRKSITLDLEDLHDFITQMVDHLHGDTPTRGFREGT